MAPFAGAVLFRLLTGRSRIANLMVSIATTWFAVFILLTPMSFGMQEDLLRLQHWFH